MFSFYSLHNLLYALGTAYIEAKRISLPRRLDLSVSAVGKAVIRGEKLARANKHLLLDKSVYKFNMLYIKTGRVNTPPIRREVSDYFKPRQSF